MRRGRRRHRTAHPRRLARHVRSALARPGALDRRARRAARSATCSTGSRASLPTRASSPRSPELGDVARRADVHVPPAARRHVPRRDAVRRAPRRCELAARARPQGARRRGWPLYPIQRRAEYADGKATVDPGPLARRTTPRSSSRSRSRSRSSPSCSRCRSRRSFPSACPQDFGERPIGTGPWKFVEWKHDDYLKFARNANYWGGAPARRHAHRAHHPRAEHGGRRVRERQRRRPPDPAGGDADWQEDTERGSCSPPTPGAQLVYVAINTTRGPLADVRVRQAINYAVDRQRILDNLIAGRGELAAGVIPSSLPGQRHDAHRLRVRHDAREAAAPRGGLPERHRRRAVDVARTRSTSASPRPSRGISSRRASARRSCSARARPRARRRERDAPISSSRTGTPTIRTPRTSSIRCCTPRTRASAATCRSTRTRSSTRS